MGYISSLANATKGPVKTTSELRRIAQSGQTGVEEKPGLLGKAIDIVSRPLYASAGAAKAAITPGESMLGEAWKGFTGKEKETYSDVLEQAGWKPTSTAGKVARGVAGFGADVLLDPTTYLGIGALTKAGRAAKAVKGAAGLATTIGEQALKGERALLSFAGQPIIKGAGILEKLGKGGNVLRETKVVQQIGKALSTSFRPKEIDPRTWDKLLNARRVATNIEQVGKGDAFDFAVSTRKEIDNLIKKGAKKEDIEGLLHAIETKATGIPEDFKPLYEKLTKYADQIAERRQSIGKSLLDDEDYNYWLHTLTKEEREKLAKSGVDLNARVFTSTSPSDIARNYVKVNDGIINLEDGIIYNGGKQIKKLTEKELGLVKMPVEEIEKLKLDKIREIESFAGVRVNNLQKQINTVWDQLKQLEKEFSDKVLSINNKADTFRQGGELLKAKALVARERLRLNFIQKTIRKKQQQIKGLVKNADDIKGNMLLKQKKAELDFISQPFNQASIQEINQAVGYNKFSTNIPMTAYEMGRRLTKQEAGTQFMNMVRDVGVPIKNAPANFIRANAPELRGLTFQPEVAEFIGKTLEAYTNDESTKAFLKMYDVIQGGWKSMVTFVNPAFHTRNAISNLWQNYLADVINPTVYAKAADIQRKVAFGLPMLDDEMKIIQSFKKQGLLSHGVFGADIERRLEEEIAKTRNPIKLFLRGARRVGITIEDNAKLAHFIDRLGKGYSPEQAAESVRKYLFDYSDLTTFERNVLKRIFPFYTWTRKNLPLQIESLIQQPGKFATLGKAISGTEKTIGTGLKPEERKYLPSYLQDQLLASLGRTAKGEPRVLSLEGFLPAADVGKLGRPGSTLLNMLTPGIKTPIELASNYNFFRNMPIQQFPGETVTANLPVVGEKEVSPYLKYFLDMIRPIREVAGLTGKATAEKPLVPSERLAKFLLGAKLQTVNIEKQKEILEYARRTKLGNIRNMIERAKEQGNKEVLKDLKQQEKELEHQKFKIPKKKK